MSKENMHRRGKIWQLRTIFAGREIRESLYTSDFKTARKRADKRLAEIEGSLRFGEVKHTWEDAVAKYSEVAIDKGIVLNTARRYADSLDQCLPFLTGQDIAKIDGKTILALIEARRKSGVTVATVKRDLTAISQVLKHAEAIEWREGNPALTKASFLKERRDPIVLPTEENISAILAVCTSNFRALVLAAKLTGCRQDELCSLTWGQFQPKKGTLEVIGKGNKRRTIQLTEKATWHISGTPHTLGSDLIFCTPKGTKWASPASYFVKIRDRVAKENPGFRPFRFHDLRHYFAVEALQGGMDIYKLAKHLGHTSVMVTERSYLEFITAAEAQERKDKSDGSAQNRAQ